MTRNFCFLLAIATTALNASHAQVIVEHSSIPETLEISTRSHKLFHHLASEPVPPSSAELPLPGRMLDRAGQVMKLIDSAGSADPFVAEGQCATGTPGRRNALCGVRWRKSGALSNFQARYEGFNQGVKSSLFGKVMAKHVALDLDTSPEIKFQFQFD